MILNDECQIARLLSKNMNRRVKTLIGRFKFCWILEVMNLVIYNFVANLIWITNVRKLLLHLGIGGHGDCSTKLFGGHKLCYDSQ